nr:single-stranded DNA-binding protein [Patescibacteria group bacterium]
TLATNRFFKGKDGETKTETCYHNMIAWDSVAETIEKYVKKGDALGISGRLNNKSVKQEDGSYKNYSQVVVEEFYFGDNKNKKEQPEAKEIDDEVIEEAINREIGDIPL